MGCCHRDWLAEKDGDALGLLKHAHELVTGHLVRSILTVSCCHVAACHLEVPVPQAFAEHAPGLCAQ